MRGAAREIDERMEELRHRRDECLVCSGRAKREEERYEIKRALERQVKRGRLGTLPTV